MENNPSIQVKITSKEFVKPSTPTPSHLKQLTLSFFDQIIPLPYPSSVKGIVFYTSKSQTQPLHLLITRLKTCLSNTLTKFYPLAGRLENSKINCNDEGIPFVQAHVNCSLSTILDSTRKLDLVTNLVQPIESIGHNEGYIHLSIQISVFTCGGIAVGWYDTHKLMDGTSSSKFFKYWAALANSNSTSEDIIEPNFNLAKTLFPPLSSKDNHHVLSLGSNTVCKPDITILVIKNFRISNVAISGLKDKSASQNVPNPTRFQAVAGFVWEQAMQVSSKLESTANISMDMRRCMHPPLPRESVGNLVCESVAKAKRDTKLPELVTEIDKRVRKLCAEIRESQGMKGMEAVREYWDKFYNDPPLQHQNISGYEIISWCKLGFNELDFGFGKPELFLPTNGRVVANDQNDIILTDYDDGIEVWICLEEMEMKRLETKQEFLAFASPYTS